jgi:hypothetical protein
MNKTESVRQEAFARKCGSPEVSQFETPGVRNFQTFELREFATSGLSNFRVGGKR